MRNTRKAAVIIITIFCCIVLTIGCSAEQQPAENIYPEQLSFSAGDTLPAIEELAGYPNLTSIDFGSYPVDSSYVKAVQERFPDCELSWQVPIAGKRISSDTESLVSAELTADDVQNLSYLKNLSLLDARGSSCPDELAAFAAEHPHCIVCYSREMFGKEISNLDTYLDLSYVRAADLDGIKNALELFPNLTDVNLIGFALDNHEKAELHAEYPDVTFYWTVYYGNEMYRSTDKKLDFTRVLFNSIDDLIELTGCFMHPEYVDVSTHGFHNSDMERICEQYPETQFAWVVRLSGLFLRTDAEVFDGTQYKNKLKSSDLKNLKYCRNLKAIDLRNQKITDISALSGLPELRVLLLGGNTVTDLSPLASLTKLQYLSLYSNGITDISAVSGLQDLVDLNVSGNPITDLTPAGACKNLRYLHASMCSASSDVKQQDALRDALPETFFAFDETGVTRGWKSMEDSAIVERIIASRTYYELDQGMVGIH